MNAGFFRLDLSILGSQFLLFASGVERIVFSSRKEVYLLDKKTGNEFRFVRTFNLRQSTQNQMVTSFFETKKIGGAHSVCACSTMLLSGIMVIFAFSTPRAFGPAQYKTGCRSGVVRSMGLLWFLSVIDDL